MNEFFETFQKLLQFLSLLQLTILKNKNHFKPANQKISVNKSISPSAYLDWQIRLAKIYE